MNPNSRFTLPRYLPRAVPEERPRAPHVARVRVSWSGNGTCWGVERVQDLLGHMQKQESMLAGEVLGEHARERE